MRSYLKKKLVFEEKDVAFYVSCMASALDYIHSKNILHRDVKPGRSEINAIAFVFILSVNRKYNIGQPWVSAFDRFWRCSRSD